MFHFSTDRLAGLDTTMILKITTPPTVPTLIPSHSFDHDMYKIPVRKQKAHRETRTPLTDKNNLVCNSTTPSPPIHLSFRRPARFIRRAPCSYTLSARPIYSPLLLSFRLSVLSLPSPRLPLSSYPPFLISQPGPLDPSQICPLTV